MSPVHLISVAEVIYRSMTTLDRLQLLATWQGQNGEFTHNIFQRLAIPQNTLDGCFDETRELPSHPTLDCPYTHAMAPPIFRAVAQDSFQIWDRFNSYVNHEGLWYHHFLCYPVRRPQRQYNTCRLLANECLLMSLHLLLHILRFPPPPGYQWTLGHVGN